MIVPQHPFHVSEARDHSRYSSYLSMSPTTKNIEPRIATMSATS